MKNITILLMLLGFALVCCKSKQKTSIFIGNNSSDTLFLNIKVKNINLDIIANKSINYLAPKRNLRIIDIFHVDKSIVLLVEISSTGSESDIQIDTLIKFKKLNNNIVLNYNSKYDNYYLKHYGDLGIDTSYRNRNANPEFFNDSTIINIFVN